MAKAGNEDTRGTETLYAGLEVGLDKWVVCVGRGERESVREIAEPKVELLMAEIRRAEKKLRLGEGTPICIIQEAGRQGFWIHRLLEQQANVSSHVVDSSSIEVNRRMRRNKTDRVDSRSLKRLAERFSNGEKSALRVCHVPSVEVEDERRVAREIKELVKERTLHTNRIRGLIQLHGLVIDGVDKGFEPWVDSVVTVLGMPLPPRIKAELKREYKRWELANDQLGELRLTSKRELRACLRLEAKEGVKPSKTHQIAKDLLALRGVGSESAQMLAREFFGWREFKNRREVAAAAGLTPTIYASSTIERQGGISKAGNPRIRWLLLQISWGWLKHQPASELALWFERRFAHNGKRARKVGIVAVARKLLVELWKYLKFGIVPAGAVTRPVAI